MMWPRGRFAISTSTSDLQPDGLVLGPFVWSKHRTFFMGVSYSNHRTKGGQKRGRGCTEFKNPVFQGRPIKSPDFPLRTDNDNWAYTKHELEVRMMPRNFQVCGRIPLEIR
jgi:hypothetical protein